MNLAGTRTATNTADYNRAAPDVVSDMSPRGYSRLTLVLRLAHDITLWSPFRFLDMTRKCQMSRRQLSRCAAL